MLFVNFILLGFPLSTPVLFPSLIGSQTVGSSSCDLLVGDAALTEAVLLSSEHCSHVAHAAGAWGSSSFSLGGLVVSAEFATVVGTETGTSASLLLSVPVLSTGYSRHSM